MLHERRYFHLWAQVEFLQFLQENYWLLGLTGEDLSRYLNITESVGLRKA